MTAPTVPSSFAIKRLQRIERTHRLRAQSKGQIAEPVDFLALLIAQDWRCIICGEVMDPELVPTCKPKTDRSISYEHPIALTNGGHHVASNGGGAHLCCNVAKGQKKDGPKAAQIKRQARKCSAPMGLKTGKVAKRAKAGQRLQSRPFQTNRNSPWKRTVAGQAVRRDR